jgi:plasmid stability protein
MSTSITIGKVPDEVRDELAARAAVCGRTLEDYIRDELMALAQRPSAAVWMARVRARKDALQHQQGAACENAARDCGGLHATSDPQRDLPSAPHASDGLVEPQRDVG